MRLFRSRCTRGLRTVRMKWSGGRSSAISTTIQSRQTWPSISAVSTPWSRRRSKLRLARCSSRGSLHQVADDLIQLFLNCREELAGCRTGVSGVDLAHAAVAADEDGGRKRAKVHQLPERLRDLTIVSRACDQDRIWHVVGIAEYLYLARVARIVVGVLVGEADDAVSVFVIAII